MASGSTRRKHRSEPLNRPVAPQPHVEQLEPRLLMSGSLELAALNDASPFSDTDAPLRDIYSGSATWGDYDKDGDLDILMTGFSDYEPVSKIYRNDAGRFTELNAGLTPTGAGAAAWGDYDRDGDLDVLLTGDGPSGKISKVYRNNAGRFTDINAGLTGVMSSSAAWGDYDNDGDLDILLTGLKGQHLNDLGPASMIYRNDGGRFTDINAGLTDVSRGSAVWGDYDNDGDLDILLMGMVSMTGRNDRNPYQSVKVTKIYENDGGIFTDIHAGLTPADTGSATWDDYDNDGDLDILLTGDAGDEMVSKVYRNDGGRFTDIHAGLLGVDSSSAWGDYDNDGDLDILLTGSPDPFSHPQSRVYRNDGGRFTRILVPIVGVWGSSTDWGDYDRDGDLDILLTGYAGSSGPITRVYRNNIVGSGRAPVAVDDRAETDANRPVTLGAPGVLGNDWDADGDALIVSAFDAFSTRGASVTVNPNGGFQYDPDGRFDWLAVGNTAIDTFQYTVSDGQGGTDTATVAVTIHGVYAPGPQDAHMGDGDPIVLRYTEGDGTLVTVVLAGGGEATLHFAGTNVVTDNAGGVTQVRGGNLALDSIDLVDTTAGNSLVLAASGGADNLATVGGLTSATPLGVISAGRVDFVGDGIRMTGDGYARVVVVHDMQNGADIVMPGEGATSGVVIVADRLSNDTDVILGSPLSVLRASEWLGGRLDTPYAYNIAVTGNPWTGVRGDLGADLTFSGADAWGRALCSLYAAGEITQSQILAEAGSVGSVVAAQWDQGLLKTRSIYVLRTTGNWADPEIDGRFGADVETTDANAASSLAAAVITGQITGNWTFAAPVGLIYAGSTANTWTLNADANVTNVLVIGNLAGDMSAEYYTSIYAGGALSAAITATGTNAADASIVSLSVGVANDISVNVPGGIHVVRLAQSVDTDGRADAIRAEWITSLVSYGDVDFDLTLNGAAANGYALVAATILGEIGGGMWDFSNPEAGNVSSIYAAATGAGWELDADGWVSSLYARNALGGAVKARYVNAAMTTGDLTADFEFTGQNAHGTSLGTLYVAGAVRGTTDNRVTVRSTGSMNSVVADSFEHASFLAGIASGVTDHAGAHADFAEPSARIGALTVVGRGTSGGRCLVDSNFSAARFGVVNFSIAILADGAVGLWCRESAGNDEVRWMGYRNPIMGNPGVYSSLSGMPFSGPANVLYVIEEGSDPIDDDNPAEGNDDFANAAVLDSVGAAVSGSNVDATEQVGEPRHAGRGGGRSLWWTWTATASQPVRFFTGGSDFDTVLAVYTGSSVSDLTEVASNDDANDTLQSSVELNAVAGTRYYIAVDGYHGDCGNVQLQLQLNYPTDNILRPIAFLF